MALPGSRQGISHYRSVVSSVLIAFALIGLSACSAPEVTSTYVGSSTSGSYARTPAGWDTAVLTDEETIGLDAFWAVGAKGAEVLLTATDVPTGVLQRRSAASGEKIEVLRRDVTFANFDSQVAAGNIRVESEEPVTVDGLNGTRSVFLYNPVPTIEAKVVQVVVLESKSKTLHSISVGCSQECFDENKSTIDQITSSWKVDSK